MWHGPPVVRVGRSPSFAIDYFPSPVLFFSFFYLACSRIARLVSGFQLCLRFVLSSACGSCRSPSSFVALSYDGALLR